MTVTLVMMAVALTIIQVKNCMDDAYNFSGRAHWNIVVHSVTGSFETVCKCMLESERVTQRERERERFMCNSILLSVCLILFIH